MMPPTACGRCGKAKPCECVPEPRLTLQDYNADRPGKHLYWRARWRHPVSGLRATRLRHNPICQECNREPATQVDHIVEHKGDERLFWNFENTRSVCHQCHAEKSASEAAKNSHDK